MLGAVSIGDTEVNDRTRKTVSSVQMVFQNPFDTLNPSHTIGSQIMRTLDRSESSTSN